VDFAGGSFNASMNPPSGGSITVLRTGGTEYVQVPAAERNQIPGRKPWVSVNLNKVSQARRVVVPAIRGQQQADTAAQADPATCEAVRRRDARRSFLGLQVELGNVSGERIRRLVEEAWRQQAPRRLAAECDRGRPSSQ
jgi:hypothetical protein